MSVTRQEAPTMAEYTPQVGHSVAARRKVPSKIYDNLIVGPVVGAGENVCRIVTNAGTPIEGDFQFFFSDWNFQFLHLTAEEAVNQ